MILNQCMTPAGREWEWLAHPKNVSLQTFKNNSVRISIPHKCVGCAQASESSLFLDT